MKASICSVVRSASPLKAYSSAMSVPCLLLLERLERYGLLPVDDDDFLEVRDRPPPQDVSHVLSGHGSVGQVQHEAVGLVPSDLATDALADLVDLTAERRIAVE